MDNLPLLVLLIIPWLWCSRQDTSEMDHRQRLWVTGQAPKSPQDGMCLRWSPGYDHVGTGSQQIVNMIVLHRSKSMEWSSQIGAISPQNISTGADIMRGFGVPFFHEPNNDAL